MSECLPGLRHCLPLSRQLTPNSGVRQRSSKAEMDAIFTKTTFLKPVKHYMLLLMHGQLKPLWLPTSAVFEL